jgi:nucleotide-binding universal stress UspA family protein
MYKNILIPVLLDSSRNTEEALQVARALADHDATLTLLHVMEEIPPYVLEYVPDAHLATSRELLKSKLEALRTELPNSRTVLTDGSSGRRICDVAEELDNDCIVVASHQPAFSDILLGSTAQHVVRHAKCAVHVIR